jgi:hypothetical protein
MTRKEAGRPDQSSRRLSQLSIVIGMALVVGGAVFWAITGRQSDLIMGTGGMLTLGGPLSGQFSEWVHRMSDLLYYSAEKERSARESRDELDE